MKDIFKLIFKIALAFFYDLISLFPFTI